VPQSKRRDVFVAIADPTRRRVLEMLGESQPLAAGAIAGRFPTAARPGVSRHLRLLRECGVVSADRHGREWRYRLVPGPLNDLRDGWLAAVTGGHERSLRDLRQRVEQEAGG
jgi:DNA-binding transcriptional ArsR family regulator